MSRIVTVTWAQSAIERAMEHAAEITRNTDPDEPCRIAWMDLACLVDLGRHALAEPDWRRIAVQVARYGGSYHGLTTAERDLLEAEVAGENEREWGVTRDRTEDAASFHVEGSDG